MTMRTELCMALGFLLWLTNPTLADSAGPRPVGETLLLQQPTLSQDRLAFVYAGDLWITDWSGRNARRLTSHGSASLPHFSPDGQLIAFSGTYNGNTDVYVIPASGGEPRRLTFHPAPDQVCGWSPDGQRILFASPREVANNRSNQLYEISATGGFERKVMEAVAYEGAWSPDGRRIAYQPYRGVVGWRLYRGGVTTPIWIIEPSSQAQEPIPHVNATDRDPLWLGDQVIFISDRDGSAANLFAYDTRTRALRQLTKEGVWEVRSFGAYGHSVVYEAGGRLKRLDLGSGDVEALPISLPFDNDATRPQWKDAAKTITTAHIAPTGQLIVVSARGDIFTVAVRDGSVRNLTQTSGIREKDALWSGDGQQIAYIAESRMQHLLVLRDHEGLNAPRSLPLGKPGYFTLLAWSPDGKTIVYQDNHLNLYALALTRGAGILVDKSLRRGRFDVSFSPDSRWLAYTVTGANLFRQIRVYDVTSGRTTDVTDGLSDADSPVFARGDILYFAASVNSGPAQVRLHMSTQERALRRGIYAAVLRADGHSPLLPRTGDEGERRAEPAASGEGANETSGESLGKASKEHETTAIDLTGVGQRIVGLPLPERRYESLSVAADGALYYLERKQPGISSEPPDTEVQDDADLYRFSFKSRKATGVKQGISSYELSADGKNVLIRYAEGRMEVADTGEKLEAAPVDLSQLRTLVDPRAEWRQIFAETWWMEKEFLYDPKLHGVDWDAVYSRYLPLLQFVRRRDDLNDLLRQMIGELGVSHNGISGGDLPREPADNVGLLGADFSIENQRYRIKTLYRGDRWNPFLKSPLTVPGAAAREGEYLLAVNGRALDPSRNLYADLENTAGQEVTLTLGADPSGNGSRQVTVIPVTNESGLRQWAWIERNRDIVDHKTGGKVAYIYLPDTGSRGFQYFNRMFFAQADRPAVIVDARRNGGGQVPDYITEILGRPYLASWRERDGLLLNTPSEGIYGPKVMLVDQDTQSGGDFLAYSFKRLRLGTLIGKRTLGALVGVGANPPLIDGGVLTVPYLPCVTRDGDCPIENAGVSPDIDVELDPTAVNRGADPQLEVAIDTVLKQLHDEQAIGRREVLSHPEAR
jgi:tricorn protease